ncbi:MAG: hypothetical protein WA190_12600 [Usitatibacter sp.]
MNAIDSTPHHLSGMAGIERAISRALRSSGIAAAPAFLWYRGEDFKPPQEATTLEAILQGRTWHAAFSREQIKACGARVERADVIRLVDDAVGTLSGPATVRRLR